MLIAHVSNDTGVPVFHEIVVGGACDGDGGGADGGGGATSIDGHGALDCVHASSQAEIEEWWATLGIVMHHSHMMEAAFEAGPKITSLDEMGKFMVCNQNEMVRFLLAATSGNALAIPALGGAGNLMLDNSYLRRCHNPASEGVRISRWRSTAEHPRHHRRRTTPRRRRSRRHRSNNRINNHHNKDNSRRRRSRRRAGNMGRQRKGEEGRETNQGTAMTAA
jgi:hypothetical protein